VIKEFKAFVLRGNVVDLAIAVVIGAAFGAVVQALVKDIVTPLISIPGKADFANLTFTHQRQRVPLRRLHQRDDRLCQHRRRRLLPRGEAGEPHARRQGR
jgi:large-conductance mechanosensitive channel